MKFEFEVNGQIAQVSAEPSKTLLYILRQNLGLTGTRMVAVPAIAVPVLCYSTASP